MVKRKQTQSFWQLTKRFFEPVRDNLAIFLRSLIPNILESLIAVAMVFLIKELTNLVMNQELLLAKQYLIALLVLIAVYYLLLIVSRNWTHAVLWPRFRQYFYDKYMNAFLRLDNTEVEKIGTGRMINIIDKGMHTWAALLINMVMANIPGLVTIAVSLYFIGTIDSRYVFVVLGFLVFLGIVIYFLETKSLVYRRNRKQLNINISRRFVKILMSKYEVLQNNKGEEEVKDLSSSLRKNERENVSIGNLRIYVDILVRILIDGSKIAVIVFLGFGLWGQNIGMGEFVGLISVTYLLENVLSKFHRSFIDFTKVFVELEKLWDTFDELPYIKGYDTGGSFSFSDGKFQISHLSFGYEDSPVLEDFSLSLSGGKKTAFVGESGTGKSTLLKLIAGYIHPDAGEIIVDGQALSSVSLRSYYRHIGYLTQDPSIFDGTILENLTYALDKQPSDQDLKNIIGQAKCEFIWDLAKGLDTEIGERGVRLSGGQKQRLAIAKIMLKNPEIILLDEPTSALDSFNEEQISIALHNLFVGRTVIIVAHRLQTVKQADHILFFGRSAATGNVTRILEQGTHEELVAMGGEYKRMLDLQSGF